jgi:uncharacterized protein (DUF1501 family)
VLLVLELQGGNDGLNTVIPVDDDRYARARPLLSEVRTGARRLADGTGLHPALERLHARIARGGGAVVHGVGYPEPDRSHFRSRDVWHVGDPKHVKVSAATTGWLGRAADLLAAAGAGAGVGIPAAALGGLEVPLLLKARGVLVPSVERVEDFQWLCASGGTPVAAGAAVRAVAASPGEGDLAAFAAGTARAAVALAEDLTAAVQRYRPRAEYPETGLGRGLQLAARLVASGFGTRLLHLGFGGFDTHARQLATHAGLLAQLDAALGAFLDDLQAHGLADRTVVFVHSEFGRRTAENASQGTDHGAAGPVFVFGGGLRAGPLGAVPDLGDLDDGDVRVTMDFRRVYRDLLAWLEIDAHAVLGGEFAGAGLLR